LADVSVNGGRLSTGLGPVRMLRATVLPRNGEAGGQRTGGADGHRTGDQGNGLVAIVVLVVIVVGLGVLLIRDNPTFSRLDELEHFNYVTSLTDRHRIPLPGEQYTQSAMRAHACYGAQVGGRLLQPCDSTVFDPQRYPNHGVTSAGGNPPVYYTATAAVALVAKAVLGTRSLFLPARLASLLWLLLGAVASYLLARKVGARRVAATSIALVAALGPMMLVQGTTVNPDAMSLLAGAGTALVWLALRETPRWYGLPVLAAVLSAVTLVKGNFLAVPPALVPAELALAAQQYPQALVRARSWSVRRPLGRVVAAAVIAEAVGTGWSYLVIVRRRAALDAVAQAVGLPGSASPVGPWDVDKLLHYAPGSFFPLGGSGFYVGRLNHGVVDLLTAVVNLLVFSGAVIAVMLPRGGRLPPGVRHGAPASQAVGYLAAGSFLVAAPVIALATGLSGTFVAYPPRYSLFIVPLGLAGLLGVSGQRRTLLFAVLAASLILAELWFLVPAP
jgi:hypothetical protein